MQFPDTEYRLLDLESPPRIRVTVADGPLAGERFVCAQPRIRLGRSNENDVILKDDSTISRSHATLFWGEKGWYISDSGSTNGTYLLIDGKKIQVGGRAGGFGWAGGAGSFLLVGGATQHVFR